MGRCGQHPLVGRDQQEKCGLGRSVRASTAIVSKADASTKFITRLRRNQKRASVVFILTVVLDASGVKEEEEGEEEEEDEDEYQEVSSKRAISLLSMA